MLVTAGVVAQRVRGVIPFWRSAAFVEASFAAFSAFSRSAFIRPDQSIGSCPSRRLYEVSAEDQVDFATLLIGKDDHAHPFARQKGIRA